MCRNFRTDIKATLLLLCALILILCALGFVTLRCGGGLTLNQRRRQMETEKIRKTLSGSLRSPAPPKGGAFLYLSLAFATPPVKRQFWKIRRFSRIANYKICFPLKLRKANAARIPNRQR